MGHGESYTCDSCGYTVHFQMGGGGLLIDYEPFVMEGKYGDHARKILEEDPSCRVVASLYTYVCRCGMYRSAESVTIRRNGRRAYTAPVRCECGKRMRRGVLKEPLTCPKCKGPMSVSGFFLWD